MWKRHHGGNHDILGACVLLTFYLNVNGEDKKGGAFPVGLTPSAATRGIWACVVSCFAAPIRFLLERWFVTMFSSIFRCPGEVSLCLLWEELGGQQVYPR